MSHRELPRSGRGCLAAVVGLPLAAAGGVAALVFAFDHPGPSLSAAPPVTVNRTLVSVRTEVRPVPLPPVVVRSPSPRAWDVARSPVPSPERREPPRSDVAPPPSARAVGPRARVEPPPADVVTTTESVPPTTAAPVTTTTEVPVTTTIPPTTEPTGPTTGSGEQGVAPEAAFADTGRHGEVT